MPRMINAKLVLSLLDKQESVNQIAKIYHVSKHSIMDVRKRASDLQLTFHDVKDMTENQVYSLLFPERYLDQEAFVPVDYAYVHKELLKSGVTLKLLWNEYKVNIPNGKIPVSYSKFCDDYNSYVGMHDFTNHIEHKPAERIEVDWSGPTMHYTDVYTDEKVTVYLFVATLPYSQFTYVQPTLDMKMNSWIECNVGMFEFIGGVTRRIVCDNLKTGVTLHPKEGDIVLNETYQSFGEHYLTAIMPAKVRKPKQKASVEGTVGKLGTKIIASLRNENFTSFNELKEAVSKKLDEFNDAPFQKREGSRKQVFEAEEKPYLRPLPQFRFETSEWYYGRKVMLDCHVMYQKNRYSVPYQYVGKNVDLRVTNTLVEVYHNHIRLTSHPKFDEKVKNRYSTHSEDMPSSVIVPEWDDTRIKTWASKIGESTRKTIDIVFESVKIKEQGYNPSLSILKLSKKYGEERLEAACQLALKHYRSPRYKHLKGILDNRQDEIEAQKKEEKIEKRKYARGAEYYGGSND